MGIKKYFATKDTSIAYSFDNFVADRMAYANTGASDILETYSLYGRSGSGSLQNEISRILVAFDTTRIAADIAAGKYDRTLTRFFLRLYNAPHGETVPRNFKLMVYPLERDWDEGEGLDMEGYSDVGGASWMESTTGNPWAIPGGDFDMSVLRSVSFITGVESLELDITDLVGEWLDGTRLNFGLLVKMEVETAEESYYTKRFFARKSHYVLSRPVIEARYASAATTFDKWQKEEKDGRESFHWVSPIANVADYTNRVYYYNYIKGRLQDIPGHGETDPPLYVKILNTAKTETLTGATPLTASWVRTGVYAVDVVLSGDSTTDPTLYDYWFLELACTTQIYAGTITTADYESEVVTPSVKQEYEKKYVFQIRDLHPEYRNDEIVRFRTFIRDKNWKPNLFVSYTEDYGDLKVILENLYYKVFRLIDGAVVVDYSHTASVDFSHVNYDNVSNYFDFDMSLLEPEFAYGIKFLYESGGTYVEFPDVFKFRVLDTGLWAELEG